MANSDLQQAIAPAIRQAIVIAIRDRPALTLAELVAFDDKTLAPIIASITIAELLAGAAAARASGKARARSTVQPKSANYEAVVMKTLTEAGAPLRSEQIRRKVGGTAADLRETMEALMAARKVKRRGQRRGTTYALK